MKFIIRTILSIVLLVCLWVLLLPQTAVTASAEATGLTMEQLREKFPDGKYWNHADHPGASNAVNNQNSYTSTPCPRHGTIGTSNQTCNGFQPADKQFSWQCMGYAEKLGYDATGFNPRENANGWYTNKSLSALDSLKPGDIVRYKNDTHSIYVTAVNGDTVTYTDCNSDGHCGIAWDETVSMSKLKATFTYVRSAPAAMSSVQPSCGCSEAYAGIYICNTASTSLNLRGGHGTGYSVVASIPKGAIVTVTKASGTGSNDWAHVTYNGISGYACAGYLKKQEIKAESVKLDKTAVSFDTPGNTYRLSATVYPENATDKTLTWISENTAVATVRDGLVTAVGYGSTRITVKTANGCNAVCVVTVTKKPDPKILAQPRSVSAESGDTVTFRVETEGEAVFWRWEYRKIYKWYDTSMAGYDTDTLTVAATGARNGYDYRCIVTFADGTQLISEPAELTVNTYITDVQNPNDQTVVLGYKGQFTASAQGEGLKYQWEYKRPGVERWVETAMEGAAKPTVYIESTTARDGYQYRCRITDVTGKVVYTEPATMRVLSFTAHPVETFSPVNGTVEFTVATNVPSGFTYQWQYRRSETATWSNTTMTGYNTAVLEVEATKARNGYQYRCVLTGSKNSKLESKAATLHVAEPVTITAQPEGYVGAVGQTAVFEVEAGNVYTYQWQYARKGSSVWYNTTAEGNQTSKLSVAITSGRNGYQYRCMITGLDGNIYYTDIATLTVK